MVIFRLRLCSFLRYTHLGTPGGARFGLEGTAGGGPPKESGEPPEREETGGPPADGRTEAEPREPGRAGGPGGVLL